MRKLFYFACLYFFWLGNNRAKTSCRESRGLVRVCKLDSMVLDDKKLVVLKPDRPKSAGVKPRQLCQPMFTQLPARFSTIWQLFALHPPLDSG